MTNDDLCFTPAARLVSLIRRRAVSSLELTRAVLDRIERVNPGLNAYCTVAAEQALAAARAAAGAIVIGKTNTPEYGAGANTFNAVFGATRNPWNPALTSGGSTGGGAVALATGMGPLAQGSDLGGSLRI